MGVVSSPALVLVTVLVMVSGVCGQGFDGFDGKPRLDGMDDAPTTTLGAKPVARYKGKPADCIWYAWENPNYPPEQIRDCSTSLWEAMSTDSNLTAFYYHIDDYYLANDSEEYLCTIGCFNLAASGPSAPPAIPPSGSAPPQQEASPPAIPPSGSAPPEQEASPPAIPPSGSAPPEQEASPPAMPPVSAPPPEEVAPPPAVPPPATATPPVTTAAPPLVASPPPATLFRPPPPGVALPPTITGTPTAGPVSSTSGASALRVFPALIAAAVMLGLAF